MVRAFTRLASRRDGRSHTCWLGELEALDVAVYSAIAVSPTPTLDRSVQRLSRAADHSKLWIVTAGLMAASADQQGVGPPPPG